MSSSYAPGQAPNAPVDVQGTHKAAGIEHVQSDDIDVRSVLVGLSHGRRQILGLTATGAALAAAIFFVLSPFIPISTSTRIIFSFSGLEKGEYPDHSKFQADDVRAPYVVGKALKQEGFDISEETQSRIRGALSVEGIIPPSIARERDRLRANGQNPPIFIPDEYSVTLTLPRRFALSSRQRELLVNEIIQVYLQNFQQTYADLPGNFGNAFETLKNSDFYEYELVLNQDVDKITQYLEEQLAKSPAFRSTSTNLTFSDLLEQTQLFAQIRLNETLGLIYLNGLSEDRVTALMKMDYYLHNLADQENRAAEEEAVVKGLLAQVQARDQNYVLGIKSQAEDAHRQATVLDQSLVDSLVANDAYNFLVRRALDAGLKVKAIQSDKAKLIERRKNMESFLKNDASNQSAMKAQVQKSLTSLEVTYKELIENLRKTESDFSRQQFANAIRFGSEIKTDGMLKPLAIYCMIGGAIGLISGIGMSLLGFFVFPCRPRS